MEDYSRFTDDLLLARLRNGEEAAFTAIYNRYWEKLLATGFYFIRDKQAAEDIVHDVMMSLWTRRSEIAITSLNTYLGTAVKFAVFKAIARKKREADAIQNDPPAHQTEEITGLLDARFLEDLLLKKTEELPHKAKLVFDYSRKQELTIVQIAAKMGLSPKAVEYHLTKALRVLRETAAKIKLLFI